MTTQTKDINMISGGVRSYVNVSQYDVGSEIKFALYNNSSAFTPPAGTTVRVEGRKPDGNGFSYSASLSDNVVTVTVTDQMTVLSGEVLCELRLTKDSVDIGTANFILAVEEAPINSDIPISDTEIPAIIELARQEQYNAEAWAQGTRNGIPVSSDDPTYHNNAKYYGEMPAQSISYYEQNGFLSKNLLDASQLVLGSISGTGEDTTSDRRLRTPFIKVLSNQQYAFSSNNNAFYVFEIHEYDNSQAWLGAVVKNTVTATYTTSANAKYLKVLFRKTDNSVCQPSELTTPQIELGATATEYMPYALSNIALDAKKADISAIGTDESGRTTASKAYAIGEHFYKDGKFCTAKTAIASGATFTLNTNYEESTIADELVVDTNNFASKHTTVDASTTLTAKYCKGIVCIQSQVYTAESFTAGAWKKIGSISKYLPKEKISFSAVTYNSTGVCYGRLITTGDIEICPMVALSGSTPAGQVFFNFSYVV